MPSKLFALFLLAATLPLRRADGEIYADIFEDLYQEAQLRRSKRQNDGRICPAPMTRYADTEYPTDCMDIMWACSGQKPASGQYQIKPNGHDVIVVYCDMETDGGGWTVFQRRLDGSIDFYRPWSSYRDGFGNLNTEFWLGGNNIHKISTQGSYELRIDMTNSLGNEYYAQYEDFRVGDEPANFILLIGQYSGNTGDSMAACNREQFSTYDRDNDKYSSYNQASRYHGAWWLTSSVSSHLNGYYYGSSGASSMYWSSLPGDSDNIKFTEMKMRPAHRDYF